MFCERVDLLANNVVSCYREMKDCTLHVRLSREDINLKNYINAIDFSPKAQADDSKSIEVSSIEQRPTVDFCTFKQKMIVCKVLKKYFAVDRLQQSEVEGNNQ